MRLEMAGLVSGACGLGPELQLYSAVSPLQLQFGAGRVG